MSDEAAEDRKERKAFWSRIEENNERSDYEDRKTDVINELNDRERNNRRRLLEKQTIQDSTNELSKFNIKTVVSDKIKSYTEPDKKHSKLVPSQEPVQEKAKNKRKRQSTLCKEY